MPRVRLDLSGCRHQLALLAMRRQPPQPPLSLTPLTTAAAQGPTSGQHASKGLQGIPFRHMPVDKALKVAAALSKQDDDFVDIKRDLALLKRMVGALYPLLIAILLRLSLHTSF